MKVLLRGSLLLFFIVAVLFYYFFVFEQKNHILIWSDTVDRQTIIDGWGTWNTHFRQELRPGANYEKFMAAVENGTYEILTISDFLQLDVQNQRLEKYLEAKTAEEAYPEIDRPRGEQDIASVNYLVITHDPISPILVARVAGVSGELHYIKLDGAHRLVAAAIKKSPIKVLFIDL